MGIPLVPGPFASELNLIITSVILVMGLLCASVFFVSAENISDNYGKQQKREFYRIAYVSLGLSILTAILGGAWILSIIIILAGLWLVYYLVSRFPRMF